jgi:biotin-dependent carboxylase-like uncharacterized protein
MGIVVVNPGLFTTIQDRGRTGYREWGVPVGGCFDRSSSDLANALVGNPAECATLEMTLLGGIYRARHTLGIALAGAPMAATIVGADGATRPLTIPSSCQLQAGETLRIGGTPTGVRTYLAVKGGWRTPVVLGSRSSESPLEGGAIIDAEPSTGRVRRPASAMWSSPNASPIRVIDGPDAGDADDLEPWLGQTFLVGRDSSRMGVRLEGRAFSVRTSPERLSMPVAPGAIQIAGGQPLVLGVACGTLGGYPHVAHVIDADLDRLGQLRPGDPIRFVRVALREAREIDRAERSRRLHELRPVAALADEFTTAAGY